MYGTKDDGSVDTSKTMTSESIVDKAPGKHDPKWEAYTELAINYHCQRCTVCGNKLIESIHVVVTTDKFVYHEEVPSCQQNPHSAYYSCPHDGCDMVFTDTDSATVINKNQLPAPAAHSYVYTVNTLNNGTHTATCSACTHSENLTHTKLTYVAKEAAACTETGTDEHYVCDDCGAWFKVVSGQADTTVPYTSADFVLNALNHDYVWSTVVDGLDIAHKGVCSRCKGFTTHAVTHYDYVDNKDGATHSKSCHQDGCTVSSSENHTWNLGEVTEAAKCNSSGIRTYTCLLCSATKTEPIDALEHQLKYTDLGNGQHKVYCDRENCTYTENVAHNLEKVEANAHDCEKDGNYAHWKCTQCGALYGVKQDGSADTENQLTEDKIVDKASGHKYEWTVKYLTLLGETGTYYHCNICKYCEDVDIFTRHAVLSADSFVYHEKVPATCQVTGTEAYYSCPNTKCDLLFSSASSESVIDAPEVIQTVSHSYVYTNNGNGTCTGNCIYSCGSTDGPKNHNLQHTATTATCTQDGTKEYWYCSNCTVYFSDKDALNAIPDLTTWLTSDGIKPATGHSWVYTASGAIINAACNCSASDSIEIKVPDSVIIFDGSAKGTTIKDGKTSVGGIELLPAIMYVGTGSTQYVSSSAAPVNAGTYEARITIDQKTAAVAYTISARDITLTVVDVETGTYTYDGNAKTTTATYSGLIGTDSLAYTLSYSDNVNAGTCTVSIASAVISSGIAGNYNLITTDTGTVVIDKATAVIYVDDTPINKIYGEAVVIPVASSSFGIVSCDKVPGDMTAVGYYVITYTVTGTSNYNGATKTVNVSISHKQVSEPSVTGTYTYTGSEIIANVVGKAAYMIESGAVKAINAGDYTIIYTLDGNHEWAKGSDGIVTWTINKAQAVITVDETPIEKTYGQPVTVPTASSSFGQVICDKTSADLTQAGSYTITYTVPGTDNYFGATKTVSVKINRLPVNEPVVIGNYTYTGSELTAVITGKEAYMTEAGAVKAVNAGIQTITYTLDGNHEWAKGSDGIVTWTINKAQAVITVDETPIEKTYGQIVSVPTASSNFGKVFCDKTSNDLTQAGSYTITYSVTGTDNYFGATKTVSVKINKLAVNEPVSVGSYTYNGYEQFAYVVGIKDYMTESGKTKAVNAGVHTITYTLDDNHKWADGSDGIVLWTINKAQAVITVDDTPIVVSYGNTVTVPTAVSNFGKVICDKVSADMTEAGSYTINYSVNETENYLGASVTVSVSVNQLEVNEPKVTGPYTYTGSELIADVTGKEEYMTESGEAKAINAGTHTITYTLNSNYKWADGSDGIVTWTVDKAQAVITLDETPIVITYGETVNVPAASSDFGQVICDKTSDDLTQAGSYSINYTVPDTDNYFGAVKTVSVTVNKLAVNEPAVNGTYTYTGSELTAAITGKEAYMTEAGDVKALNAGTYTITYTLDSNHAWADGSDGVIIWTVEKAYALITVDETPIVITYGETVKIPVAVSNFGTVNCDKVSGDMTNAGSYVITYNVPGTDNYYGSSKTVSVTVNQLVVKEPVATGSYTYTGSEQTAVITGKEAYMTESGETHAVNAGKHTITYTIGSNYKWADGSDGIVVWTIEKVWALITVDETPIVKTYGEAVKIPAATSNFGKVECSKVSADMVDAGSYVITYSVAGTENYYGSLKTVSVTINQLAVKEPTVTGSYTYTGSEQTAAVSGKEAYMTESGEVKATKAGVHTITYKLDNNHKWADGSDGSVTWSIAKAQASIKVDTTEIKKVFGEKWTLPTAVTTFGTVTCDKTQADLTNVGTYTVTYTVAGTTDYAGDSKVLTVKISALAVNEPTVSGDYKYNGKEQTVSLAGVESFMTTKDSLTQTETGIYTVNFKLDANHIWADGSDGIVTWEIKAAQLSANDKQQPAENNKQTVIVETDEGFPSDVQVIVEVTAEASVAEQIEKKDTIVDYNNIPDDNLKLGENEQIGIVFKVKLVRMVDGVAEEIQPSDIAPGTKIRVKMLIPEDVDVSKVSRILHVHSESDIEEIPFDISKLDADRYYEIEIDRFSEFAFVYELSEEAAESAKTIILPLIIIIAVIIAAAIVFIWFILGKKKKKEKENN